MTVGLLPVADLAFFEIGCKIKIKLILELIGGKKLIRELYYEVYLFFHYQSAFNDRVHFERGYAKIHNHHRRKLSRNCLRRAAGVPIEDMMAKGTSPAPTVSTPAYIPGLNPWDRDCL